MVMSPVAEHWSRILSPFCKNLGYEIESLSFQQIIHLLKADTAVRLTRKEFLALLEKLPAEPELTSDWLSVRTLQGTSTFADGWGDRLLTGEVGKISGSYNMGFDGDFASWTISTSCQQPVFAQLTIKKNKHKLYNNLIEMDASPFVCKKYSIPCKINKTWARSYFKTQQDIELQLDSISFIRGDRIDIDIDIKKQNPNDKCWVVMNDFYFKRRLPIGKTKGFSGSRFLIRAKKQILEWAT